MAIRDGHEAARATMGGMDRFNQTVSDLHRLAKTDRFAAGWRSYTAVSIGTMTTVRVLNRETGWRQTDRC